MHPRGTYIPMVQPPVVSVKHCQTSPSSGQATISSQQSHLRLHACHSRAALGRHLQSAPNAHSSCLANGAQPAAQETSASKPKANKADKITTTIEFLAFFNGIRPVISKRETRGFSGRYCIFTKRTPSRAFHVS